MPTDRAQDTALLEREAKRTFGLYVGAWRCVQEGRMPAGPSEDYKKLLRGEITSEEYVRRLMAKVKRRLRCA